jgi:exodeoxyribonuclease VII large subunit
MNSFLEQFGDGEASSVTEYTRRIKRLLEGSFGPEWIRGEVSNLRKQASGHLYFSLKDENAQLPVVMFRGSASGLDFEIHDGMELLIYGELSVYEPHGRYQLIARGAIESGQGRLHREFERLKKKLLAEGLFDKERKRSLPEFPRHIGFITSPSGAAVQDFIRILKRRGWTGRLTVFPAKVQGRDAAQSLIRSLAIAMRLPGLEVLVVGRGGGSLEDLWCFNDESFARALAESPVPTISAVGHEIDFALSDFVADVRAETPSAAAELISSSFLEFLDRLEASREFMFQAMESGLEEARRSLGDMHARLRAVAPQRTIETAKLKLDELVSRFQLGTRQALGSFR